MDVSNLDALSQSQALHLQREKCSHIVKAARSATTANIVAPLLCIPAFQNEVRPSYFYTWLIYMAVVISIRTVIVFKLKHVANDINHPSRDLKRITFAIGIVGFGWGLGWPLLTPDLSMVDRMIYVYMTTAAMIASMFAYSVNRPTFYAFTLPIMIPAMTTLLWPANIFPWTFSVGLGALFLVVISIATNFSKVFEKSVNLQFRNEDLYQALASERDNSVSANIAKSKFIAVASHDLRQPLQAININLDLFDVGTFSEKDAVRLQQVKKSVSSLNVMFDEMLNMSKLDAYSTSPSHRDFYLSDLSDYAIEIAQSKAAQKNLALNVIAPDCIVHGDLFLLRQIIANLVLNAVQYTEHGFVDIEFQTKDSQLQFCVKDTGIGISNEDIKNVFNEFYRVDETRGLHEGLGLGLTIVKRLCDLIDASITVESEPHKGSVFCVHTGCPVKPIAAGNAFSNAIAADLQTRTLQGKRIAICDDDDTILDAYQHMLSEQGAHVFVLSENSEELQAQLADIDHIDCVLTDYRLRQTTGDVLIERLRENYNDEIPAIIVTADTSPAHIQRFQTINVPVLYKPVTLQSVLTLIETTIAKTHG